MMHFVGFPACHCDKWQAGSLPHEMLTDIAHRTPIPHIANPFFRKSGPELPNARAF
jgi:hypothetical protein